MTDAQRLEWVLPILSLAEGDGDARALRIAGALMLGKTGLEALDEAMRADGVVAKAGMSEDRRKYLRMKLRELQQQIDIPSAIHLDTRKKWADERERWNRRTGEI